MSRSSARHTNLLHGRTGVHRAVGARTPARWAAFPVVLLAMMTAARADEPATQPADVTRALQTWQALRSLPDGPIVDTLGFIIDEAADLARLADDIESLRAAGDDALDPRLALAHLRCRYLAASIDGAPPDALMQAAREAATAPGAPFVRAEAAHRAQIAALSRLASARDWSDPLTPEEVEQLTAYLACHGASQRAVASIKRLAEEAVRLDQPEALAANADRLSAAARRHPLAAALAGRRAALDAIGSPWGPPLRGADGAAVDWSRYRGKPLLVMLAGAGQTPSQRLETALRQRVADADPVPFGLVILRIGFDSHGAAPQAAGDAVELAGGWRAPVVAEFGIRALPAVLLLDRDGILRQVIRFDDWRIEDRTVASLEALAAPPDEPPAGP